MSMTGRVRKFAISIDPEEVVEFEEPLSYYDRIFSSLGFEQVSTYRWRIKDQECTITADLNATGDGYEVWITVQAPDAHEHRVQEVTDEFDAFLLTSFGTSSINKV